MSEALDAAQLVRRAVLTEVGVDVPAAEAGRADNWLRDWASGHGGVLEPPTWSEFARFTVLVPPAELTRFADDLAAFSAGSLRLEPGADRVVDLPG